MLPFEKEVRSALQETLESADISDVPVSEDLIKHGMDSLNCMSLVVLLEERFGVCIPDDRLGLAYVRNIGMICTLLCDLSAIENAG